MLQLENKSKEKIQVNRPNDKKKNHKKKEKEKKLFKKKTIKQPTTNNVPCENNTFGSGCAKTLVVESHFAPSKNKPRQQAPSSGFV